MEREVVEEWRGMSGSWRRGVGGKRRVADVEKPEKWSGREMEEGRRVAGGWGNLKR